MLWTFVSHRGLFGIFHGYIFLQIISSIVGGHKSNFLLVTDDLTRQLIRIDLDLGNYSKLAVKYSPNNSPWGVAYNPQHDTVYWTDRSRKWIGLAGVNSPFPLPMVFNRLCKGSYPQGMSLDPIRQVLFYVDTGQRQISAVRLSDLKSHTVILQRGLERPKDITLHYTKGYMFWTDVGSGLSGSLPRIERAVMDGTNRTVIINTALRGPEGIAVDMQDERLYWTDGTKVESSTLDGGDRRIILTDDFSVFRSVAISPDHVYVAGHSGILRMNKDGGNVIGVAMEAQLVVIGMDLYIHNQTHTETHTMQDDCLNSTSTESDDVILACKQLCVTTLEGSTCFCPSAHTKQGDVCISDSITDNDQLKVLYNYTNKQMLSTTQSDNLDTTIDPFYSTDILTGSNGPEGTADHQMDGMKDTFTDGIYSNSKANKTIFIEQTNVQSCNTNINTVLLVITIITSILLALIISAVFILFCIRRHTKSLPISQMPEFGTDPNVCLRKATGPLSTIPRPTSNGHKYETIDNIKTITDTKAIA